MDDQQNEPNVLIAWILGIAVTIAIVVSLVIGILGALSGGGKTEAKAPAAASAPAAIGEVDEAPALATGPGVPALVKFHFETGKADLPADAAAQVQPLVAYLNATPQAKVAVSGFHDKTGDPAANAALAKTRALATRALLVSAGAAEDKVILVKPREATGGDDDREARRVEVYPAQ